MGAFWDLTLHYPSLLAKAPLVDLLSVLIRRRAMGRAFEWWLSYGPAPEVINF